MPAGQSPLDFLHQRAPQLAQLVEETQARALIRGTKFSISGYTASSGDLHIVQVTEGGRNADRAFTMQFNPSGTVITTEYGEGRAKPPKAPVVALEGAKERLDRARYPELHGDTLSAAAARGMLSMWEMQMLPLKLTAAALEGAAQGWQGGAKPAEVVQLQVGERATTVQDRPAPTNPARYGKPVLFANADDAASSLRDWAHRSMPTPTRLPRAHRPNDPRGRQTPIATAVMKPAVIG
ncbi:MAG: hypothetical protein AAF556_10610 [Pseudomonadota bacterium]